MRCEVTEFFFLIDGSESVRPQDFAAQVASVKNLAKSLLRRSLASRVTFGEYSTAFMQSSQTLSSEDLVDDVTLIQSFGVTQTATAILEAIRILDSIAAPQRFQGAGEVSPTKVLVLLTDGQTSQSDIGNLPRAISTLQSSAVQSVVIGVGDNLNQAELEMLALQRTDRVLNTNVGGFSAEFFDSLLSTIEVNACPAPRVPDMPCMELCGVDTIPTEGTVFALSAALLILVYSCL